MACADARQAAVNPGAVPIVSTHRHGAAVNGVSPHAKRGAKRKDVSSLLRGLRGSRSASHSARINDAAKRAVCLSWFTAAEPPPPPPPPPSPPSVHAKLALSSQHFVLSRRRALGSCGLLLTWVRLRRRARASSAAAGEGGRRTPRRAASRCSTARRAPSRRSPPTCAGCSRSPAAPGAPWRRRATQASTPRAPGRNWPSTWRSTPAPRRRRARALLRACAKHGIGAVVLCSDAGRLRPVGRRERQRRAGGPGALAHLARAAAAGAGDGAAARAPPVGREPSAGTMPPAS